MTQPNPEILEHESQKYLFLLSQLGVELIVEQDPKFTNKWKIGRRFIRKDQLEKKLREVYELCRHCQQLVQQVSYQGHRLDFNVDFKKWGITADEDNDANSKH